MAREGGGGATKEGEGKGVVRGELVGDALEEDRLVDRVVKDDLGLEGVIALDQGVGAIITGSNVEVVNHVAVVGKLNSNLQKMEDEDECDETWQEQQQGARVEPQMQDLWQRCRCCELRPSGRCLHSS